MTEFTIKDLENLSGIKAHTIRIWEQRYSFLKPRRSSTNIRHYTSHELKTVLNISLLNKYGFKISHINRMTPEVMGETIRSLTHTEAHQERIINELLHAMIDLHMERFEEILDDYIYSMGIDRAINYLVFPFLERIGILWITDHIKIAQEHLVSHIIRQKIIMGIQNASPLQHSSVTVVMFLPPGEHHEIGLLYMHYLLKIRGVKIYYLGPDTPIEDLAFVCSARRPSYAYTHLSSIPPKLNLEKYLQDLNRKLDGTEVVLSGSVLSGHTRSLPAAVHFKKSLPDVLVQFGA